MELRGLQSSLNQPQFRSEGDMKTASLPPCTRDDIRRIFHYQPDTGLFTRISTGKPSGYLRAAGYVVITINRRSHYAHRIAWYLENGTWPECVDHKNGAKHDNRIENLRPATKSQNGINRRSKAAASSGVRGVYRQSNTKKWRVRLLHPSGCFKSLGYYETKDEAERVAKNARDEWYGEFSSHSDALPPVSAPQKVPSRRRSSEVVALEKAQKLDVRITRSGLKRGDHSAALAAISYDKEAGTLTWQIGTRKGMRAGHLSVDGREYVWFLGRKMFAHRFAWFYVTGQWPASDVYVDHVNGDTSDNRWANLRLATRTQNSANTRVKKSSTSGVKGAFTRPDGHFVARIMKNGRSKYIGYFKTADEAGSAYFDAAKEVFGEFASRRGRLETKSQSTPRKRK